jgi:hypothetical protein
VPELKIPLQQTVGIPKLVELLARPVLSLGEA